VVDTQRGVIDVETIPSNQTDSSWWVLDLLTGASQIETERSADDLAAAAMASFAQPDVDFDLTDLPGEQRLRRVNADGEVLWRRDDLFGPSVEGFRTSASQTSANDQDGWQYVICFHDITQAQCLERMKAMLVNRLAHKLRTPLTVITGVNGLIAQQAGKHLDAELKGLLQQSAKQSEECAAMIERFVEYTSLNLKQGGSFNPYESCPIEELLAYAIEASAELIAKMSFKVTRVFPRETYSVQGEESKIRLVFHHIIQNAVKFGKPGGKVEVDATESEGTIAISFVDDGPGIPPREMDYLFHMLHQVDMENTGEVPGAGLGLWFARDIVQAHGGTIQITSPATEGVGGTRVELRLPASSPDQAGTKDQGEKKKRQQTIRLPAPTRTSGG
jgi:signal transduction histidine kinase